MRIDFRQGVVSYQAGGFLESNGNNINILAAVKPTTVSIAHGDTNYLHSEDNLVSSAWSNDWSSSTNYWLYWEFNPLTFERVFSYTTLEPVTQSVEPGLGDADIVGVTPGDAGIASFVVGGHYIQSVGKNLAIVGSTANDDIYTVSSSTYNTGTGETTIFVDEEVLDTTVDGQMSIDVDFLGDPLKVSGRIWFNTSTNIHYILTGGVWVEFLCVFAALLTNRTTFISMSINGGSDFTGTQIGNTNSVLAGRVLFSEDGNSILRDNGTFFTTEDQFFSTASRVDGIRIESNVSRAQFTGGAAISAFSPVTFIAEGKIGVGQYNDVEQTVIGMLMEDLLHEEVGAVVIQGVVTNPAWDWPTVGVPLWVDNGSLNPIDPHVSNPLTYPQGRVPVARVLSSDSVVFEQGLGGVGAQGPTGSVDNLPPATVTDPGAVRMSYFKIDPPGASDNIDDPIAVSTSDPRMTDSRIPQPHPHDAVEISFTPRAGLDSADVQSALEEVGTKKVSIAGDTMTDFLTLAAKPTEDFHAATKNYVDQFVLGLVWLEPVDLINMISDVVTTPPTSPETGDAYIVPPGAGGVWSTIDAGNITHWNGDVWQNLGAVTGVDAVNGARFGISFSSNTIASGSFAGHDNEIVQYDLTGDIDTFETPTENNALFVSNGISSHAYKQYVFNGTSWIQIGGTNNETKHKTINTQTGTSYTLTISDDGQIVEMDNANANTVTIPPNSSVTFEIGTVIEIVQYGAGQTTIVEGAGVTIRTSETLLLQDQYSAVSLYNRAIDEWVITGRLEVA